jgi:CRP-like cAMP-binding protein
LSDHRRNLLLRALPDADYAQVEPYLATESMEPRQVLCELEEEIEHVWFVQTGVVSLLNVLADGAVVECGTVGWESGVGLEAGLRRTRARTRQVCQVEGVASRMRAAAFRDLCARLPRLAELVVRQMQAMDAVHVQSVACYAHHPLESRLARWLLTTAEHVGEDAFPVTHEFVAAMLGVQRTTVSLGAGELQQRGLISISRGRVTIRDREGLKRRACECHGVLRRRLRELLPFGPAAEEAAKA